EELGREPPVELAQEARELVVVLPSPVGREVEPEWDALLLRQTGVRLLKALEQRGLRADEGRVDQRISAVRVAVVDVVLELEVVGTRLPSARIDSRRSVEDSNVVHAISVVVLENDALDQRVGPQQVGRLPPEEQSLVNVAFGSCADLVKCHCSLTPPAT